jgi:lipopolysaccharide transport system permease protein
VVLWALFAQGFERGNTSFLADERMITKVYFPRLVLPVAASFSAVIDFGISTLLAFPICLAFGVVPGMNLLYAFLAIPPVLLVATTCGIVFASLSIRYRDFRQVAPFLIQIWFYATPVVYSLKSVPATLQPYVLANPMTVPVLLFRHAFTGSGLPPLWSVALCYSESLVLVILALAVFRTVERRMADWL